MVLFLLWGPFFPFAHIKCILHSLEMFLVLKNRCTESDNKKCDEMVSREPSKQKRKLISLFVFGEKLISPDYIRIGWRTEHRKRAMAHFISSLSRGTKVLPQFPQIYK